MPELVIDPEIRPLVQVGTVAVEKIAVRAKSPRLTDEIEAVCGELRARHGGKAPAEIDGLTAARTLYRAFQIDPTSTRPSSEALLRRVLQAKPFPGINSAVDVSNLCSVSFLLPIGLYDASKIQGRVTLRRGRSGESYRGIRKDDVHLAGRPVLVDDTGPFGNPTSDSLRTSVDTGATSIWMVIFAPAGYPASELISHESFARSVIDRYLRTA